MAFSALDSELLGPLFATEAMRSVFSDRARLAAMLAAEAALARAQARFGIVPAELADAISAIDPASLDAAALGRETAVAGVPTIPFVKAVQALIPAELERSFHKAATTQDIVDTALVLQVRDALALISAEIGALLPALLDLAARHRETPCVGRTYGQHAAPVTFGYKVAIWCCGIAEVADRLPALRARALVASLGGPVGTLAGLGEQGPAVAEAFAQELRLGCAPIAWHVRRAAMVDLGVWLATLLGACAKMATDIVHLASTEVAEVAEPHVPGRGGSSAMPHKRNPVASTIILAAHTGACGQIATLLAAMAALHERPPGAWHAEWQALPQLFGLVSGALREVRLLAEGLVVDVARMRANLDATQGLLFADAVAARLAPRLGREAAHALVERAAEAARARHATLRAVLSADQTIAAIGGEKVIDPAFDLEPGVRAAALWTDRAAAAVQHIRDRLES